MEASMTINPAYKTIELVRNGAVVTITLNRPEKLNALNDTMLSDLSQAFDDLADYDHRVVVVKGAGRAFSAGYDAGGDADEIGYAAERSPVEDRDRQLESIDVFMKLWRHPVPVITQVHGYCMAGATQLCVFSDLIIVAEDALIAASPSLPIGGGFISPLWSSRVGPSRAKLMSFDAGHRIDGNVAVEWGWATTAVPAVELDAYVTDLSKSIARTPASILKLKKEAVNRTQEMQGFLTTARMGAETDALLHLTPEIRDYQASIQKNGLKKAIAVFNDMSTS